MESCLITTPVGILAAQADANYLLELNYTDLDKINTRKIVHPILLKVKQELDSYFLGKLKKFTVPLKPTGTLFQEATWKALQTIPYGKTISYLDLANKLNNPKAFRAAANANGKNPLSIIIPCHRVVYHNGGLGGYTGGLWRKEFLLALERKK